MSVVAASRYDDGLGLLHLRNLFIFYLVGQCARASQVLEMSLIVFCNHIIHVDQIGVPVTVLIAVCIKLQLASGD